MTKWSLSKLLEGLHEEIQRKLEIVRGTMGHPGAKGDASEKVWIDLLNDYLPKRYKAKKAFVVDSEGRFSDQIDVVIFDRQYSPLIFHYEEQTIIPAESVYSVFEARQVINANNVKYAQEKVASVRQLQRTSLPIPYAGGTYPAKSLIPIYGGILAFESDWNPAFGQPLLEALDNDKETGRLDFGCVAAHGYFFLDQQTKSYEVHNGGKPATAFLFKLISQLQAYARWLIS